MEAEMKFAVRQMRAALVLIAGDGCSSFTSGPGSCIRSDRKRDAVYVADRWCDACIAFDALAALPSSPVSGTDTRATYTGAIEPATVAGVSEGSVGL
jgi:hypothetical protein